MALVYTSWLAQPFKNIVRLTISLFNVYNFSKKIRKYEWFKMVWDCHWSKDEVPRNSIHCCTVTFFYMFLRQLFLMSCLLKHELNSISHPDYSSKSSKLKVNLPGMLCTFKSWLPEVDVFNRWDVFSSELALSGGMTSFPKCLHIAFLLTTAVRQSQYLFVYWWKKKQKININLEDEPQFYNELIDFH